VGGRDSVGIGKDPAPEYYEHSDEPLRFIKDGNNLTSWAIDFREALCLVELVGLG